MLTIPTLDRASVKPKLLWERRMTELYDAVKDRCECHLTDSWMLVVTAKGVFIGCVGFQAGDDTFRVVLGGTDLRSGDLDKVARFVKDKWYGTMSVWQAGR